MVTILDTGGLKLPIMPDEHRESLWSSFNRDDRKLFVANAAGTVTGGLLVVAIVAIAIAVKRAFIGPGHPAYPSDTVFLWAVVLGTVIGLVNTFLVARQFRSRWLRVTWAAFFAFYTVISVLILLGQAAGVK
jgi:hypothetical protein